MRAAPRARGREPATRRLDEVAQRLLTGVVVEHLAQARLVFLRRAPPPARPGATEPAEDEARRQALEEIDRRAREPDPDR